MTLCHCSVGVKWRSIFNRSTTECSVIRLKWQIRLPAAQARFLLSFSLKSGRFWEKALILRSRAHLLASEVKRPIIRWEPGGRCPTSVLGPAAGSFKLRQSEGQNKDGYRKTIALKYCSWNISTLYWVQIELFFITYFFINFVTDKKKKAWYYQGALDMYYYILRSTI